MVETQLDEKHSDLSEQYFDLEGLSVYSSIAVPTLRKYIKGSGLPHYKLGKILVRRSEFDAWMEQFKGDERESLDTVVEDVLSSLKH